LKRIIEWKKHNKAISRYITEKKPVPIPFVGFIATLILVSLEKIVPIKSANTTIKPRNTNPKTDKKSSI
jgi:hypothetical protein